MSVSSLSVAANRSDATASRFRWSTMAALNRACCSSGGPTMRQMSPRMRPESDRSIAGAPAGRMFHEWLMSARRAASNCGAAGRCGADRIARSTAVSAKLYRRSASWRALSSCATRSSIGRSGTLSESTLALNLRTGHEELVYFFPRRQPAARSKRAAVQGGHGVRVRQDVLDHAIGRPQAAGDEAAAKRVAGAGGVDAVDGEPARVELPPRAPREAALGAERDR